MGDTSLAALFMSAGSELYSPTSSPGPVVSDDAKLVVVVPVGVELSGPEPEWLSELRWW
jgi:hypothetical protein